MSQDNATQAACKALRTKVGFRQLPDRVHVDVTDRHRARFIHNMSTCDITGLSAGQGAFGLTVDRGGKLLGQFFVEVSEEVIRIELAAARREDVVAHWTRHRIADMVRFASVDDLVVIAVVGPGGGALLDGLCEGSGASELAEQAWGEVSIAGAQGRVRRNDQRLSLPGWDLTVPRDAARDVVAALTGAGAVDVSEAAWTAVRVANGVPGDEVDMGVENIPLESEHLHRAISWEKGCYIGQEVIARMHYRGQPNRYLRGLLITAETPPAPGDVLVSQEGKEVGVMGTVCPQSEQGAMIALAVVKRHFAEPGTPLVTSGGAVASVVGLPFEGGAG